VFVKKGEVESKMLSALLTGVNRAYPYAKGTYICHSANMNFSMNSPVSGGR